MCWAATRSTSSTPGSNNRENREACLFDITDGHRIQIASELPLSLLSQSAGSSTPHRTPPERAQGQPSRRTRKGSGSDGRPVCARNGFACRVAAGEGGMAAQPDGRRLLSIEGRPASSRSAAIKKSTNARADGLAALPLAKTALSSTVPASQSGNTRISSPRSSSRRHEP